MKSILLLLILSVTFFNSYASNIVQLEENLTLEVSSDFKERELNWCKYSADNGALQIYVTSENLTPNFNKSYVLEAMDTIKFNLKNYIIKNEKDEWFYELKKDYSMKYYTNKDDKIITYTFYTKSTAYCILFAYKNKVEEQQIDSILDSIYYTPVKWGEQYSVIMNYSKRILIAIMLILIFFSVILFSDNTKKVLIGVFTYSVIFTLLCWGYWWFVVSAVVILTFILILSLGSNDSSSRDSDGPDVDFDSSSDNSDFSF